MINFGNIAAGAVLPIVFSTYGKTNGESITLTGLAVTDIEVYKGTSMVQRASDAGYTLLDTDGIDIDGITGIHGFSIDTGDNTDAGFYTSGSFYTVVVSAVTVDAQVVNFVAATFHLVAADPLTPTVAGRTLDVSATGEAGIDWANVGSPTTTVGLSGTTVGTSTTIGATGINAIADQVWDEVRSAHTTVGSFGEVSTVADVADAVWDEVRSGHTTSGTFGEQLPITSNFKKAVALSNFSFQMFDTNGDPATAKTVSCFVASDGAVTFTATATATATEQASGWYKINLTAAEMNANIISFKATATGCKDTGILLVTQV